MSETQVEVVHAPSRLQRAASEALGSALLLAIVVGSGIMAERLAGGNVAIALLANTLATGAGLVALILTLSPVSSHFNPVVTLMDAATHSLPWRDVPIYLGAQVIGAFVGVWTAHLMFAVDVFQISTKVRTGGAQLFSEFVATFGLLLVIASVSKHRREAIPYAVGCYITAAYWFTASTSFANPAVTLARAATESFAGIRPIDAPEFIVAQLVGLAMAIVVAKHLFKATNVPTNTPITQHTSPHPPSIRQ
ncbi:MIP family channel protein [Betaproteobacteria bacterium UKL13-2]|jgi:glycerol uptake facilitator-like aquaporin|nr:MIP family channel protein [Betaproteobacteria bacterium UKL13-2]HCG51967.1 aquaporin family protein [Betaproteobacteria bacterium]